MNAYATDASNLGSRKRKRRCRQRFSIDILADGSEGTGSSSVFLSLWGDVSSAAEDEPGWWEEVPVARYALSLASDTCSRLATDQRYKLAATRAIFCPGNDHRGLWGWPAVQLALRRAGAPSIHVVSGHARMDAIVGQQHGRCPQVVQCQLSSGDSIPTTTWWKVYEDDRLLVHARAVQRRQSSSLPSTTVWAFLYSIYTTATPVNLQPAVGLSFLVLPSTLEGKDETIFREGLPLHNSCHPLVCSFCLFLETMTSPESVSPTADSMPIFVVGRRRGPDLNLLVRARLQANSWHKQDPVHFPWTEYNWEGKDSDPVYSRRDDSGDSEGYLTTGTSLCWWEREEKEESVQEESKLFFHQLDRLHQLRELRNAPLTSNARPRHSWPDHLESFLQQVPIDLPSDSDAVDDNEIDLEDDASTLEEASLHDKETTLPSHLELFTLGTGCAAPSAYRGASAYLLRGMTSNVLANNFSWSIALEAGEGFVTQFQRHVSRDPAELGKITLIWISHAHWDHYGGLVPLLYTLRRECGTDADHLAPLVLAPRSVLRYCQQMLGNSSAEEWFYGVAHEDVADLAKALALWNSSRGSPIAVWKNVRVDHSCRSSFGCVFGLRTPGREPYSFAFSGDTRPCSRFVQECIRLTHGGAVDFLLHEASFDDEEKEMSIKKKHSTVKEAIQIGEEVRARCVLLTHFSQRYDSLPTIPAELRQRVGFALDGMKVVLVR